MTELDLSFLDDNGPNVKEQKDPTTEFINRVNDSNKIEMLTAWLSNMLQTYYHLRVQEGIAIGKFQVKASGREFVPITVTHMSKIFIRHYLEVTSLPTFLSCWPEELTKNNIDMNIVVNAVSANRKVMTTIDDSPQ